MTPVLACYPRHRFLAEIIGHAAWMYHVFGISLRDHELIVADRGVVVMRESTRHCLKFGADLAGRQRRRPLPGDPWHLDDVLIRFMRVSHYLRPGSTRTGRAGHPSAGLAEQSSR